ncbi:MAG TPA: hypothetical protein VNM45_12460 [Bacillus sp. (in: firmicutes)]|nr:hypothetical protein [Bacillus sp. (in: firmicutes)]
MRMMLLSERLEKELYDFESRNRYYFEQFVQAEEKRFTIGCFSKKCFGSY